MNILLNWHADRHGDNGRDDEGINGLKNDVTKLMVMVSVRLMVVILIGMRVILTILLITIIAIIMIIIKYYANIYNKEKGNNNNNNITDEL